MIHTDKDSDEELMKLNDEMKICGEPIRRLKKTNRRIYT